MSKKLSLQLAISFKQTAVLQFLLIRRIINVNAKDIENCSPLHIAANVGQTDIVKLLLAHPYIDTTIRNNDSFTPADIAELYGHYDIAKLIRSKSIQKLGNVR